MAPPSSRLVAHDGRLGRFASWLVWHGSGVATGSDPGRLRCFAGGSRLITGSGFSEVN